MGIRYCGQKDRRAYDHNTGLRPFARLSPICTMPTNMFRGQDSNFVYWLLHLILHTFAVRQIMPGSIGDSLHKKFFNFY